MYIHKLGKSTSGGGGRVSMGLGKKGKVSRDHKRISGEGLVDKIYEDGKVVHKPMEALRKLNVRKPQIPKKYISLDV
jgi:hypothetical protein